MLQVIIDKDAEQDREEVTEIIEEEDLGTKEGKEGWEEKEWLKNEKNGIEQIRTDISEMV